MNMYDDIYDQEPLREEQEFGMMVSELIDKEVERRLEEKVDELRLLRDVNRSLVKVYKSNEESMISCNVKW
ncbi:hypothetical protein [Brevibacillus porteri]|uniref:hypothetical protein n=1 Tax=Brevibacillus porteri TaxID=2126350 RepID=UPI003D1B5DEA